MSEYNTTMKKLAKVVHVAKQNGDFTSINQAINAVKNSAKFSTPYVIKIAPGIYQEGLIDIPPNIYLEGLSGKGVRVAANIEYEVKSGLGEDLQMPIENIYVLSPEDNTNDTWDGNPLTFNVYRIAGYTKSGSTKTIIPSTVIFSDGGDGSNWAP